MYLCIKLLSPRPKNSKLFHFKIALQYLERRFSFSVRMLGSVVFVIQTVSESKPIKLKAFFFPTKINLSNFVVVLLINSIHILAYFFNRCCTLLLYYMVHL